jgi:carbamoyltransferase
LIVLGLVGRVHTQGCHDAAACLLVDGEIVGALEQERVSRRRHALGEGPEGAVRVLLDAHNIHPSEVDAVGYAWADAPAGTAPETGTGIPCGVHVSDGLTETLLPTLAAQLGTRQICFFDHHLCHAVGAYCLNRHDRADILVADGWGGDGSTSLFHVADGRFRLLERYERCWSLGMFYGAASTYANLGWWGGGKLMGLSSYCRPSELRFMRFDAATNSFSLEPSLRGLLDDGLSWDGLARQWLQIFETRVFPYSATSANAFDYAPFAADAQMTVEELGLGLAERLRRISGEPVLLLSGGVALNAHMNRRIARESGYAHVCGTVAPNDGGTVFGAAFLAAALHGGQPPRPLAADARAPIFLGPPAAHDAVPTAAAASGASVRTLEPEPLRSETAAALAAGRIVAWFDGPCEFGPRALGARSLLAAPQRRTTLDRLNLVKGRAVWRPAALSLTAKGFASLGMEPPVDGLSDYMLCTHAVQAEHAPRAIAGVHVDGTTRGQLVGDDTELGRLLAALGEETGVEAAINTSLNTRGEPMVLTAEQAVAMLDEIEEIDLLIAPPHIVAR